MTRQYVACDRRIQQFIGRRRSCRRSVQNSQPGLRFCAAADGLGSDHGDGPNIAASVPEFIAMPRSVSAGPQSPFFIIAAAQPPLLR